MSTKKLKPVLIYTIFITVISILLLVFGILLQKGFQNFKINQIGYIENNNINYKVYIKKDYQNPNYFEGEFITEGKTYITSLIDYIDSEFVYNAEFDDKVKGTYDYKIVATISANKTDDSGNYLTKEYVLKEKQDILVSDAKNIYLSEKLVIDYNKYNDLLNAFQQEFALSVSGLLKVELMINTSLNNDLFKENFSVNSKLSFDLPLTLQAFEAGINLNEGAKNKKIIKEKVMLNDIEFTIYKIAAGIVFIIILIIIYLLKLYMKDQNELNKYEIALKKILSSYDSVIVNIEKMPDITDLQIMKVESFEELIDAHSEIRMPINFYKDERKDKAIFFLMSEGVVWVYTIRKHYEK